MKQAHDPKLLLLDDSDIDDSGRDEDEAFYLTHTKDGKHVAHDNELAEYLEER